MSGYIKKEYYDEEKDAKRSLVSGLCSIMSHVCFWIARGYGDTKYTNDALSDFGYIFCMAMFCVAIYVFGMKALAYHSRVADDIRGGFAKAGKICGIISMVVGVLPLMYTFAYIAAFILFDIISPGPWLPS